MRRRCYAARDLVLKSAAEWSIASFTEEPQDKCSDIRKSDFWRLYMFVSNVEIKPQHQRGEKKLLKQEVSSEDTDGDWSEWRGLIGVGRGTCRSANKLGIVDGRIHYMAGWTINLCVFWGVTRGGSAGPPGATRGPAHRDLLTLIWFWFEGKNIIWRGHYFYFLVHSKNSVLNF